MSSALNVLWWVQERWCLKFMGDEKRVSSNDFTERVVRARPCRWTGVFQHRGHCNIGRGHLLLSDGANHRAFLGVGFLICEMGIKTIHVPMGSGKIPS